MTEDLLIICKTQVMQIIEDLLADKLLGLYLTGSAVDEGLRLCSDIDFLVIVDNSLSKAERRELCHKLLEISGEPGNLEGKRPLEVTVAVKRDIDPWSSFPFQDFQYGEWLRSQIEEGEVLDRYMEPDLTIMLKSAFQKHEALLGPSLDQLISDIPDVCVREAIWNCVGEVVLNTFGDERNSLLTLARMWSTLVTGKIVSKNAAATWALRHLPVEHQPPLQLAQQEYLGQTRVNDWREHERAVDGFLKYMLNVTTQLF